MKPWIAVSYFTENTFYADYANAFSDSAKQNSVPHYVESVPNLKDWSKNTNYKPEFILRMLNKFPHYDIVWVDIDAKFKAYPILFDTLNCNIAAFEFDQRKYYSRKHTLKELLSGTLFLRNDIGAECIVKQWIAKCKEKPKQWDQKSLQEVVGDGYYRLPGEYCKIFGRMNDIKNPIIEHYQASRQVRKNKRLLI